MTPIATASTTVDEATLLQGFRWMWKGRRWINLVYLIVAALSLSRGAWIIIGDGAYSHPLGWLFVAGGIYCLLRREFHTRSFRNAVKRMPSYGKEITWTLSEEALELVSEGALSRTTWDRIYQTCITPEGFLIYAQRDLFYWLPRSAFSEADAPARVEALLRSKTKCAEIK